MNFKNVIKKPKISKKCNIYLNKPKMDHYPTSPKITTMNNMTEIMMMIVIIYEYCSISTNEREHRGQRTSKVSENYLDDMNGMQFYFTL